MLDFGLSAKPQDSIACGPPRWALDERPEYNAGTTGPKCSARPLGPHERANDEHRAFVAHGDRTFRLRWVSLLSSSNQYAELASSKAPKKIPGVATAVGRLLARASSLAAAV